MQYDVFISYSRKDKEVVQVICKLFTDNGITFWYDNNDINPGEEFFESIVDGIKSSTIVLFISSKNSNNSIFTAKEVAVAFNEGKYIIPYKIDMSSFNKKLELVFSDINWIEAYPFEYSKAVKLVRDIKTMLQKNVEDKDYFQNSTRVIIDMENWNIPQSKIGNFFYKLFKDK